MDEWEKLICKFPIVIQEKLNNKEFSFPSGTLFDYSPLYAYRAVERKSNDTSKVTTNDFKSYFELGKKPKKMPRGNSLSATAQLYGVSLFLKKQIVEQIMKFPNPNKKIVGGKIYSEGGPQLTNLDTQHVCWWLYENVDLDGFRILAGDE